MPIYELYEKRPDRENYIKHGSVDMPVQLSIGAEFEYNGLYFRVYKPNQCMLVYDSRIKRIHGIVSRRISDLHSKDEDMIKSIVLNRLNTHFDIKMEVPGKHITGQAVRIDAVMVPKNKEAWGKNADIGLGVEFKNPLTAGYGSRRGRLSYYAQCIDYSFAEFENYGNISVFICPIFKASNDILGLLALYKIGSLDIEKKGLTFRLNNQPIWDEETGAKEAAKKISFKRKYGVRNKKS